VFVKGAPDFVLDLCNTYIGVNGEELPLNDKQYVMDYVVRDNFAKNAFRTLLIAYKDIPLTLFE
jgi:magnesium-transporting ATPase (P-type)